MVNVDSPDYIKSPDEFHFIPESAEAIAMLTRAECDVIVITNQSAIGRGMINHETLQAIFTKMKDHVARAGGKIKDIFFCPHTPDDGCQCRKPLPGLIEQAVDRYKIDLTRAAMVGDSAKDIACARAAGCAQALFVLSGKSPEAQLEKAKRACPPDGIYTDLMAAAKWIIQYNDLKIQ